MTTTKTKTDAVKVRVYGKWKKFESREEAMDFFMDGILSCDGAERGRYLSIYLKLKAGATEAFFSTYGIWADTEQIVAQVQEGYIKAQKEGEAEFCIYVHDKLTVAEFCKLTQNSYGGDAIRKLAQAYGIRL